MSSALSSVRIDLLQEGCGPCSGPLDLNAHLKEYQPSGSMMEIGTTYIGSHGLHIFVDDTIEKYWLLISDIYT